RHVELTPRRSPTGALLDAQRLIGTNEKTVASSNSAPFALEKKRPDERLSTFMNAIDVLPEPAAPAAPGTSFLELSQLADLLHVSAQTLRRLRAQRGTAFPEPIKIGRRLLFDLAEVKAFLARLREGKEQA